MKNADVLIMVETIQKLLKEESDLKAYLRSQSYAFTLSPMRIQLMRVKALLKNYSDQEIDLAKNWDSLKEKIWKSARKAGDEEELPRSMPEEDDKEWWGAIFLYLMSIDQPKAAFLSLSMGWTALLFIGTDDEPEPHEAKPKPRKMRM